MPASSRLRPLAIALLASMALLLGACGGGGGGTEVLGSPPPELAVATTSLPGGSLGNPYAASLVATGAQGSVQWRVTSGGLPPGLALATGGGLTGTPSANGVFGFEVEAADTVATATASLSINVGMLTMSATAGLTFGDAWTNVPVTLSTNGQTGTVTFSIQANESGGALSNENGSAGTATWTPGATGGTGIGDRIRATDAGNGTTVDLDLEVMPDPAASHAASFGASDVWWIDTSAKDGTHAFTSDYHNALADVGLRAPGSTDATGTEADQLAALWIRIELRRQLNPMFLRNADGSEGAGLAITFPLVEPGAGYTKPSPAATLGGSPTRYSQMAITDGTTNGVIGTAFLDGASNGAHENDTTSGTLELGVFPNQITPIFNSAYGNTLDNNPITAADVDALRALLYELPTPGGRYTLIRNIGRGFARTVAAVLAHEVGHSLGLAHSSPSQPNSIMNASALISPSASYAFTSEDVAALQSGLPGAGKSTGSQTASQKASVSAEGGVLVQVCRCRACTKK